MKNMNVYAAIGHFKGSKNITCVTMKDYTRKSFEQNLRGNEFVAYAVITEKKLEELKKVSDSYDMFNEAKKLTSNYRLWDDLTDYLDQCLDIVEEKMNSAE